LNDIILFVFYSALFTVLLRNNEWNANLRTNPFLCNQL